MPEFRQWAGTYEQAWQELDARYGVSQVTSLEDVLAASGRRPGIKPSRAQAEVKGDIVMLRFYDRLLHEEHVLADSKRPDVKLVYCQVAEELFPVLSSIVPSGSETLNFLAYTPSRVVDRREAIGKLDTEKVPATLIYTLHDDNVGLLPALTTGSLHELTKHLRQPGWARFSTRYLQMSFHDPLVMYIANSVWDASPTTDSFYDVHIPTVFWPEAFKKPLSMSLELDSVWFRK